MNEPVDSSVAVRIMVKEGKRSVFTIDLASDHVHSRLVSGAIWMASALNAEIIKLARQ
jgi:aminopeptidase C